MDCLLPLSYKLGLGLEGLFYIMFADHEDLNCSWGDRIGQREARPFNIVVLLTLLYFDVLHKPDIFSMFKLFFLVLQKVIIKNFSILSKLFYISCKFSLVILQLFRSTKSS